MLVCNWLGIELGMKFCQYFSVKVKKAWSLKYMSIVHVFTPDIFIAILLGWVQTD